MPAYSVQVRQAGKVRLMEISATNPELAKKQAKRFGTVLAVNKSRKGRASGGMSVSERYIFLVRLSTMLASKVGAAEALRLLRDSFGGRLSSAAAGLLERVELGADLPSAIGDDTKNFPGAVGLIVKIGASSGQSWRALQEAAEFERRTNEVKKGTSKGLVSAVFAFFLAGAMMIGSQLYIAPQIMKMDLIAANKEMTSMGFIEGLSLWTGILMVIVLVVFSGFLWLATIGRRLFPGPAERIIMKVPYYSDIVLAQDNYINLHRFALLVRAGVRMEEALTTSYQGIKRGALKEDFKRALEALRKGKKWAAGMQTLHPTDRAALMLASDREQIATNLENIGAQYQALYIQRISVFTPFLQVLAASAMSIAGLILFAVSVLPMLQVSAGMMDQ